MFEKFLVPEKRKIRTTSDALDELHRRGPTAWHEVLTRLDGRMHTDPATGCVDWAGSRSAQTSTPTVWLYGRLVAVAKVLWVALGNPPTTTEQRLSRTCGFGACLNPKHWTVAESVAAENRGKLACPKGHEYTPRNTVVWNRKRYCVACNGGVEELAMYIRPTKLAFGYFKWDDEQQKWTTEEERNATAGKGE